jgi:hypothetical protein
MDMRLHICKDSNTIGIATPLGDSNNKGQDAGRYCPVVNSKYILNGFIKKSISIDKKIAYII